MRCDIIMPVWNQPIDTRSCVDSIIKHTGYPYRLIIVDNGSGKDTQDYLKRVADRRDVEIELIRNDKNLGFAKAINQGIRASSAPYLCIINNDTIVTDGWLEEMIRVMEAMPGTGIVNPSSNTSGQFPRKGESIDAYAARRKDSYGQTQELYNARGFCMLLKRGVVEKTGLFDESYGLGYFEETDYCRRARQKGFGIVLAKASYVYHKEGATFKNVPGKEELFRKNEEMFFKRWGLPLKAAYFIDRADPLKDISGIAAVIVRSGHQFLLFLKKGVGDPVALDHFDIRRFNVNRFFFWPSSVYKIFKRKKKKKINIILTDDRLFGNFLKMIKFMHGSDVVVNPDKKGLFELLTIRSRVP